MSKWKQAVLLFFCFSGLCLFACGKDEPETVTEIITIEETIATEEAGTAETTEIEEMSETEEAAETNLPDIEQEIEEYRMHFIELYTSNAMEETEDRINIEEMEIDYGDNGEPATLIKYTDLSGEKLRYQLQFYGETGRSSIDYYLCKDFVLISRKYDYYSSWVLTADYSDVLYSTIENWIVMDENVYFLHSDGELEKIEKTQLEAPTLEEIEAFDMEITGIKNREELKQYYGVYEITDFWPTLYYYRGDPYDRLRVQEADMMLGHIVEIKEDFLETYECFRWAAVYDGHETRIENYQIEKVSIENPAYEWERINPASTSLEEFAGRLRVDFPIAPEFEDCREKICGRINVKVDSYYWQEYYVMEDGIMMHSIITGQYFYLKKLDKEPDKAMPAEELSEEEKEKIIQDVYGSYTITEFMPTKFYPALDSGGDILLPQGEADMMIGREIVINEQLFTTYDNGRLPNSQFTKRLMDEYLLEKIEITTPDYQIERKSRDDIFGLRDDMLPEEMRQEEYIEINVNPGYGESIFDSLIPQIYLLNDGRLLLYAMGEYFLLEKAEN